MRRVILASGSKARRKLLRQCGLKFSAAVSSVKERHGLKTGCGALVVENAMAKARDVAKKRRNGVVISADTVVLAHGRIIGKPKNAGDARRMLKLLSRRPQWVYTGIAVLDIDKNKAFTDYDRTKIYMNPMTDSQIREYFKKISPLDKAGGFDIQGEGGRFIRKIEGCFYNVVGLPLEKLAGLLKKTGIELKIPHECVCGQLRGIR